MGRDGSGEESGGEWEAGGKLSQELVVRACPAAFLFLDSNSFSGSCRTGEWLCSTPTSAQVRVLIQNPRPPLTS